MNEFNVGDIVRVVDEPYTKCPFSWVKGMSKYLGTVVTIRSKKWSPVRKTYKYFINEDDGCFAWCANCFTSNCYDDFEIEDNAALIELLGIVSK